MEFVCVERLGNEDEYEGYTPEDYNIYMLIENSTEELEMRKYLIELKKRFKFLRNSDRTELCVFLSDTTKAKAMEFSTKLKKRLKEELIPQNPKKEFKPFQKKIIPDYEPTRVISTRCKNGVESVVVFDIDSENKIHYITSIKKTKHIITKLKRIMEDLR